MNGIQEHQRREPSEGWWNYRGLWRESLDERPSAASVYRWLLIAFTCLSVLSIFVNSSPNLYVNGIRQPVPMFIFPSIEGWPGRAFFFIIPFIVYGVLWYWGKIANNRHVISVLMYLMILIIGWQVATNAGYLYGFLEPIANNLGYLYRFLEPPPPGAPPYYAYQETHSIWWDLFDYLVIPTLLLPPILVMWIQGWRQALIFSLIIFLPYYLLIRLAAGKGT